MDVLDLDIDHDERQRSTDAVLFMNHAKIVFATDIDLTDADPTTDPTGTDPGLVGFCTALFDLRARLDAGHRAQLDATIQHLSQRPDGQDEPGPPDAVAIRVAAERAVADDRRRICAFELPELVHETPEQLTDATHQDDTELKRRLGAALDLAMQAPPSLVRFRDEITEELRGVMRDQNSVVGQQITTLKARASLDRNRRRWGQRRRRRLLDGLVQPQGQQARENLRRMRQLRAQLDVIAAVEAARQEWAHQSEHAAVLGEGVAAAEVMMERHLAPSGVPVAAATTEPIRAIRTAVDTVAAAQQHEQQHKEGA